MSDFKAKMHRIRCCVSLQRSSILPNYIKGPTYKWRQGKGGQGRERKGDER